MLDRLFIKDYKNTSSKRVRNAYGVLASVVGIILNVILSSFKIAFGVISGSVAITADGLNNLSDAGSSIVTMLGFRIASIPADKHHPYGHARVEYVASMIVSFIVLFLGCQLIFSSIRKLITREVTEVSIAIMIVLAVSIVVKFFMFLYYRHMGKKIDSDALRVAGIDSLNDSIATIAVLISSVVLFTTGVDIDGCIGSVVAVYILISGAKIFKETISPLLGEKPSSEFIDMIKRRVLSYEGVIGVHDLMVHNYGPKNNHVTLHVEVDAKSNIMESHDLVDRIERDFKADDIDLVIHMDPIVTDDAITNNLKELVMGKAMEIDANITIHDFRAVVTDKSKKLIFDIVLPSTVKMTDEEVTDMISSKLKMIDSSIYIEVDIDRNYLSSQE